MNKGKISIFLRKLKLIDLSDWIIFQYQRIKNRKNNKTFIKNNPDVVLPPDYILYESFQIDYAKYYHQSISTAKSLIGFFEKYLELKNVRILDWGCGPGRVIRHLPKLLENNCEFFGADCNKKSIDWCKKNIPDVQFTINELNPPLEYQDNFFDIIYGISVLTHLSESMHYAWFEELNRVLKKTGIIYLTTQGESFRSKLTPGEVEKFDMGEIVIRGKVKEGHRTFSAFQPKEFMYDLFSDCEILEHIEPKPEFNYIPQDIWMIRKK